MPLLDEDWVPAEGDHYLEALDARFAPVACPEHSRHIDLEEGGVEREGDGFQPTCADCLAEAERTRDHVNQVERGNRA